MKELGFYYMLLIFSLNTHVFFWKMKKVLQLLFKKILDQSNGKPNKIWVDKGDEFYNGSVKSWLQDNNTEMYSVHNEGKSVAGERFIWTLKNKICKYITLILQNLYIDKLDVIINKCNNRYHEAVKMKPVDLKSSKYTNFIKENNEEGSKCKIDDHVRISKYKNIFSKVYVTNWSDEVCVIKIVKKHYVVEISY